MSKRIDYGKPGDPSGCYFPKEWRVREDRKAKATAASSVGTKASAEVNQKDTPA